MPVSHDLTTLTALAQALSRTANLADALGAALATVAELLGLETGWVWLLDDDTQEPQLAAARARRSTRGHARRLLLSVDIPRR